MLSTSANSTSLTAGQTALIDNTGGVVTGTSNVMQRAVDNVLTGDNIGYHHYSSPMAATTIGDLAAPGFVPVLDDATSPDFNTARLVSYVQPFPTVFGYDETRVGSTTLAQDQSPINQGYFAPTDVSYPWAVGKGYSANVPNGVLVDFVGQFNNAPAATTFSGMAGLTRGGTSDSGWQLLGNPFPAPLDFSKATTAQFTNLDAAVYQYHATSRYGGFYTTYQVGATVGAGLGTYPMVPAGGGFFARVSTAGTGSMSLLNTNRTTTFANQASFGRATASTRPLLTLTATAADGTADALTVYADANATLGLDSQFDAVKMTNPNGLNLAARTGTTLLAIDGLPAFTAATVVPLSLAVPAAGTYTLALTELTGLGSTPVYLRDAATGTEQLLTASPVRVVIANAATASVRYALVFRPAGALATTANVLAAQATVFPNPAAGAFTLALPPVAGAASATATLLNALGQTVNTRTLALAADGARTAYATTGLAPGIYTLRVQAGREATALRVVVQ